MRGWAVLGLAVALAVTAGGEELVDGIAAQVGSEIVLISEVRERADPVEVRLRQAGAPDGEIARVRVEVLESLIERALVRQLVRRAELEATPEEVDSAIAAIARENGLRLEQLRESVEAQGLPFDVYRERIRGELEQTKVINGMVASKIRIEEKDVRSLYDQVYAEQPTGGEEVRLRHLLVPLEGSGEAGVRAACERAGQALARIRAGEDFVAVAREVSSANPELGWIHAHNLAGWMAVYVRDLAVGGVTDPIEAPFGCNLLQVVERRGYEPITFEQARGPLRERLFQERMRQEYLSFIGKLREQTYIERKGLFADAARLGGAGGATP